MFRMIRRIAVGIVGTVVLLVGFFLIFLPGPALLFIPLGIAILALEFKWAKSVLNWFISKIKRKS